MNNTPSISAYEPTIDNPWFSIWWEPRNTIRTIIETDPEQHIVMLASLSGIAQLLNLGGRYGWWTQRSLSEIMILSVLIGPILGLISLYLGGVLFQWVGSWLGGTGTAVEIRAALAWSAIPKICHVTLSVLFISLVGTDFVGNLAQTLSLWPCLASLGLLRIWHLIVSMKCLGEAHNFSAWKALATSLLAGLIIVIPLLCLSALFLA